jgi:acetyltransferase-like isoleucine patch superfamily enzyme
MLSYLIQLLFPLIPETRLFRLKSFLLRLRGYKIGNNVSVFSSAVFRLKYLAIGDNSRIGSDTLIAGGDEWIRIGRNVGIGPRCLLINGTHEIGDSTQRSGRGYCESIVIGDGTTIFAHSTILSGVSIGHGCVVAAGSLVRENVEDNCFVAGIPAKLIRKLPD